MKRFPFSEDVAKEGLKGATKEELETMLLDALVRVDALETAIAEALEPGKLGWEFLDADDMAERLVETYDPFDHIAYGTPEDQAVLQEKAKLAEWNAGKPIQGMTPAGYYVVRS